MLDYGALHGDDVQRAVGSGLDGDGAEVGPEGVLERSQGAGGDEAGKRVGGVGREEAA
jgi:hypothetical protein